MSPVDLHRRVAKLTSILDVAKALTAERDLDRLLAVVMTEAAKVVDADRCTLFLLDRDRSVLWSKIAQGMDAGREIRLPLGVGIAGTVAQTGAVVNLPDAYADPRFNRAVDDRTGYVTRTLLCVPMRNTRGDVTGVIQALNKEGGPFTGEDEELLIALGGQAASAIENAVLNEEIQRLFEGFVKAAVVAIESRDPTTGGHSERVALLTTRLADAVETLSSGPWSGVRFTPDQRMEIRYAALLHDFGKVGVREHVLVKAEKLYPHEMALLEQRFEYARKSLEVESLRRRLHILATGGSPSEVSREEEQLEQRFAELGGILDFVRACNRPTVLPSGGFEKLHELRSFTFPGVSGAPHEILSEHEVNLLSISRGSLSLDERREIESHVTHTFRFLSQIPWTRGLRRVPDIAYGHHERLDGKGYPRALAPDAIGVEARMMSVSDVYDALTASDRPYKKAVPHPLAIQILDEEAKRGQLDRQLVDLFRDAEVPRLALGKPEAAPAAQGSAVPA